MKVFALIACGLMMASCHRNPTHIEWIVDGVKITCDYSRATGCWRCVAPLPETRGAK